MATVRDVYTDVCDVMLEPGALVTGIVTDAQFLDLFRTVLLDFWEKTGLVKQIFTQPLRFGLAAYTLPDDLIRPDMAFVGGILLEKTSQEDLDDNEYSWRGRLGTPDRWRNDAMPPKQMEVFPSPSQEGTLYPADLGQVQPIGKYGQFYPQDRNLTVVGTAGTTATSFSLDSPIPNCPDSFVPYLGYGVLERIFSTDGEAKDTQRAAYCGARYSEGCALAQAYMGQA